MASYESVITQAITYFNEIQDTLSDITLLMEKHHIQMEPLETVVGNLQKVLEEVEVQKQLIDEIITELNK